MYKKRADLLGQLFFLSSVFLLTTRLCAVGEQRAGSACRKLPTGNFSGSVCSIRQFVKTLCDKKGFHTFLNAPDDKMFRTLRSTTKGSAFRIRELFVEKQVKNKFSTTKNFSFCCNERSRRQATCARAKLLNLHLTDNANRVQAQPASFLDIRLLDHQQVSDDCEQMSRAPHRFS